MEESRQRPSRPRDEARVRAFDITPEARPWLQRRPGQCAWPVGQPDVPMRQRSCCAPTGGEGAYCARHRALAGKPSIRRPEEDEALIRWLERRRA